MSEPASADSSAESLEREVFAVRDETFTLRQVLGAAEFFGTAGELWDWLGEGLACETYAAEEGFELDENALQSAVDDFRYRRQLLDTEQTEAWLAARRLSEEELVDALARELWRRRFSAELADIRAGYAPEPEALAQALWPELIVHDRLKPPAVALARRIVSPELAAPARGAPAAVSPLEAPAPAVPHCPDWARCADAWRKRLQCLDSSYRCVLQTALSPRHLAAALAGRRLDLTRVRFRAASFSALNAAREAYLCITQDGEPFDQAVGRAETWREDRALFLAETPATLLPFLVSAVPGETYLAEEEDPGPLLFQVIEKNPPRLEDPEVRSKLESALLARTFDPAVEERVRWLVPLE